MIVLGHYKEVWLVDFEFHAPPGHRPDPLCMVAVEIRSGRWLRLWADELRTLGRAPFGTGPDVLVAAYCASAEMGCFIALGWPMPANLLDLYVEFRRQTCGKYVPSGKGLLGALVYFGLPAMGAVEKKELRELALRGGPYTEAERAALLDYCADDVRALAALLPRMEPKIDHPRCLLRGRYMKAAAYMEWHGIPLDVETWQRLISGWETIKDALIQAIGGAYGIYQGQAFSQRHFAAWLNANRLPWPLLPTGALSLSDDTFKAMAAAYPQIAPIRELRNSLSQMRLQELQVGPDGRNRVMLSVFRSRTGRNQPSSSQFIFGPATWFRALIKPGPGQAIAYVDWAQQEFGIAAALSGDPAMLRAYQSGDPYLEFAKIARAAPPEATKASHKAVRDRFKATVLGVQYAMGPDTLAERLGMCSLEGRQLLRTHKEAFPRFWRWSDSAVDFANLTGHIHTVFGWTQHVGPDTNPRALRNFPMQANGAEILRLACCYAVEVGIKLCAPIHDALLIEAPADQIDQAVEATQACMRRASADVLGGFELESDAKIVRYPERYMDDRGKVMWATVIHLLDAATRVNSDTGTRLTLETPVQYIKKIDISTPGVAL